jgi:arsenate reductase (glutaredoxin)
MRARIYHNPRCSKSRAALELLQARGVAVDIVDYLKIPPSKTKLLELMRKLDVPALAMVRTSEPEFRAHAGRELNEDELAALLAAEPRLLQRPIVELGDSARVGRPPERILELFE